ncbi:enoyl-CoA hydratase/isomerase family protein [Leucobacter sp. CSA1]|uniref:Enoyl-CoA hydratase/isomerase family protein n=1 Tax=Leucobacter chromiisoli TaxID=2796471 RepID=A0A934Q4K0_9MICO|nr:enoyl-CoA hydratase/isomerase family protein [Leucobacter chromiisoli]MBK0418305.1 enoyl-CoA hydratase/isomerase family protein [Leucobacter chromiisoli]
MGTTEVYVEDGIGYLVFSTPGKLNAFTRSMRERFLEGLRRHEADDTVEAVIVTGEGDAFCAGQDLNESASWDDGVPWVEEFEDLYRTVWTTSKPVIAAIPGVAAGGGFQLALLCDARIASTTARMGQPEVANGLASITGAWLMRRSLGDMRARELALSARLVEGEELLRLGIVDEMVEADGVRERAIAVARKLASSPSQAFASSKRWLFDSIEAEMRRVFEDAVALHRALFAEGVSQKGSRDFVAKVAADVESR